MYSIFLYHQHNPPFGFVAKLVFRCTCKDFCFLLVKKQKNDDSILPHFRSKRTSGLEWSLFIDQLMFRCLSVGWKIRLFLSERKVTHIYAILVWPVLHKYTVVVYNYAFNPFAGTPPSVRVHILYCPSTQPIVECLKKLSRPCAHGWRHVCTLTFCFLYSGLCTLYIYAKKHPLQSILLWWNGDEIELRDLLPTDVKKEEYNMVWNSGIIAAVFCLRSCYNSLITCWSRSK